MSTTGELATLNPTYWDPIIEETIMAQAPPLIGKLPDDLLAEIATVSFLRPYTQPFALVEDRPSCILDAERVFRSIIKIWVRNDGNSCQPTLDTTMYGLYGNEMPGDSNSQLHVDFLGGPAAAAVRHIPIAFCAIGPSRTGYPSGEVTIDTLGLCHTAIPNDQFTILGNGAIHLFHRHTPHKRMPHCGTPVPRVGLKAALFPPRTFTRQGAA